MLVSLLGTRHFPAPRLVKGGVLFLEDVGEGAYRVERMRLQLQQAGVLASQAAVLLGHFSGSEPRPQDRGYRLRHAIAHLRGLLGPQVPVLTGLPFGHVPTKVTLPVGRRVQLQVQGRDALVGW